MKTQLIVCNNHFIAVIDGGNFVIDTGSPFSMSEYGFVLRINDNDFDLNANKGLMDNINNSPLIDIHVDGLIGLDVMSRITIEMDRVNGVIGFDEPPMNNYGNILNFNGGDMGILFPVKLNSHACVAIFDSGANISYVSSDVIGNAISVGEVEDYNPMLGQIITTLHEITIDIQGVARAITVAKMTRELQMMLAMLGVKAVLGIEPLGVEKLRIDVPNRRLEL